MTTTTNLTLARFVIGVDRAQASRLSDARLAMTNFVADMLSAYRKAVVPNQGDGQLLAPESLKLLPLFINAMLRHVRAIGGWISKWTPGGTIRHSGEK